MVWSKFNINFKVGFIKSSYIYIRPYIICATIFISFYSERNLKNDGGSHTCGDACSITYIFLPTYSGSETSNSPHKTLISNDYLTYMKYQAKLWAYKYYRLKIHYNILSILIYIYIYYFSMVITVGLYFIIVILMVMLFMNNYILLNTFCWGI